MGNLAFSEVLMNAIGYGQSEGKFEDIMPSKREMKAILGEVQAKQRALQSQVFWQWDLARL